MEVIINKHECVGCGICADKCPDIFELEDKLAIVKVQPSGQEQELCSREAADVCPVNAIAIKE